MIQYEFRKPDRETSARLIELSYLWAEENCCHGMVANEAGDLREPLAVALDDGEIIGYIFGHFYKQENRTSYIETGKECFCVDELYVLPQYRSHGTGKALFRLLEQQVREKCEYITLATSMKDYKSILKFYTEYMGMDFHSAFLIKSTREASREDTLCE